MDSTLVPPRNVVAVMGDGRRIPLDCVYAGPSNGKHLWTVTWVLPEPPTDVLCDELPVDALIGVVMALNDAAGAMAQRIDPAVVVAAALSHERGAAADSPTSGRGGYPAS